MVDLVVSRSSVMDNQVLLAEKNSRVAEKIPEAHDGVLAVLDQVR